MAHVLLPVAHVLLPVAHVLYVWSFCAQHLSDSLPQLMFLLLVFHPPARLIHQLECFSLCLQYYRNARRKALEATHPQFFQTKRKPSLPTSPVSLQRLAASSQCSVLFSVCVASFLHPPHSCVHLSLSLFLRGSSTLGL